MLSVSQFRCGRDLTWCWLVMLGVLGVTSPIISGPEHLESLSLQLIQHNVLFMMLVCYQVWSYVGEGVISFGYFLTCQNLIEFGKVVIPKGIQTKRKVWEERSSIQFYIMCGISIK